MEEPTEDKGPRVGDLMRSKRARALVAVTVAVLVAAYIPVFSFWWRKWFEHESHYSHAPFVPIASTVLIVLARKRIASLPLRPSFAGFALMLPAAAIGWAGHMGATTSVMGLMFPLYFFGAIVAILGWPAARALQFPVLFLYFMCVLPESAVNAVTFRIQMASTATAAGLLNLLPDVDAVFRGARIDMANASVRVGEACSGFRLLISMAAVATFLGYFHGATPARRLFLLAITLPLGLAINALRIAVIAAVGEYRGSSAMLAVHDWTGWLVLLVAAAIMLKLSRFQGCAKLKEVPAG